MAHILLVEDDPSQAFLLSKTLEKQGHQVCAVLQGGELMAALDDFAPDLVLMDLQMYPYDGFELAAQLREHPRYCYLTIVALTALSPSEIYLHAKPNLFDGVITKPLGIQLPKQIEHFLSHLDHC